MNRLAHRILSHLLSSTCVLTSVLTVTSPLGAATIRVPGDQPTIQAGVNAASTGDSVLVAPGTYSGPGNRDIDFGGRDLTLLSEAGPAVTIIDCQSLGRGFFLHSGETRAAVIEGFTIQNGMPVIGEPRGGAFFCVAASPTIQGNRIQLNRADTGGGIFCSFSEAEIRSNTIAENECSGRVECGAGIACVLGSAVRIAANTITHNVGAGSGGGIFLGSAAAVIEDNLISGNETGGPGAGIVCFEQALATISRNTLTDNVAHDSGGAISCVNSLATIEENLIRRNAGIFGAAIYCVGTPAAIISGNTLVENSTSTSGAGAVQTFSSSPTIERNIIAFSLAGNAVTCVLEPFPDLSCNDFFENAHGNAVCGNDLGGNFSADPLFCDAPNGDFTLFATSPCLPGQHPGGVPCGLIGAFGQGCGPTAIEPTTWGAIKAGF